jgi:cytosine/adenosine deaminase-related metal-dependent hydrolase
MTKHTADWIYPVTGAPIKNGVIILDDDGKILALDNYAAHDPASAQHHVGVIVPGFINTHCHLELSHMKGLVPTGSTLIPFITGVVTKRNAPPLKIRQAIDRAEKEMIKNGIVAVGDISNTTDTFSKKAENNLLYCTFTEVFDFLQTENAEAVFSKNAEEVHGKLSLTGNSTKNFVPHAPYSVSKRLFELINAHNAVGTVSIHNQETQAEQDLFLKENGAFYYFYARFGVSL